MRTSPFYYLQREDLEYKETQDTDILECRGLGMLNILSTNLLSKSRMLCQILKLNHHILTFGQNYTDDVIVD